MTVINRCVYNADKELMAPRECDITRTHCPGYGGFPSFDIGCYHKFVITSAGRNYDEADDNITAKVAAFYRKMNQVEGFSTLRLTSHGGETPVNGGYTFTYEVIYVIEATGSRTQNPDSPYPGYQRDMRRLSRRPVPAGEFSGALPRR